MNGCQTDERDEEEIELRDFPGRIIVIDLNELTGSPEELEGRDWLESRLQNELSVGWDIEWKADQCKESNKPVALVQFACEDFALLIRTHITQRWLPSAVSNVLMSDRVKKINCGYDVNTMKQKMLDSFGFEPVSVVDVSTMAQNKGLGRLGFKSLGDHFKVMVKKDNRQVRSDWTSEDLTEDQIKYAAEDAYFPYLIHDKLEVLSDVEDPDVYVARAGVLELQDGWAEQGIARKLDGLWCELCGKGPMFVPESVAKHIESKVHMKKLQAHKSGDVAGVNAMDLDGATSENEIERKGRKATRWQSEIDELLKRKEEYRSQGIVFGDENNPPLKVGESKCTICDKGPFTGKQVLDAHLSGKEHKRKKAIHDSAQPATGGANGIATLMWNLPDYVRLDDATLICTLCESKSYGIQQLYNHLGGDKHAKKCRAYSYDEIIYVPARNRLEVMLTGKPVIRSGCEMPEVGDHNNPQDVNTADVAGAGRAKHTAARVEKNSLPAGYLEHFDPDSGNPYYEEMATGRTQWERPTEALRVLSPTPVPLSRQDMLPPGWKKVWDEASRQYYYADIECQIAQWTPPQPHVEGVWARLVDPEDRAYWDDGSIKFYEGDMKWRRLADHDDRVYWSCKHLGVRFFEPEC